MTSEPGQPRQRDLPMIAVDIEDDVAAVCGKMDSRPEPQVVLYIRGTRVFRDSLSFNRLRRHGHLTGKQPIVVSPSQAIRTLSQTAGLPSFGSVREAERWASGPGWIPVFGRSVHIPWLSPRSLRMVTTVGVLALLALGAACVVAPSATVTLRPELGEVPVADYEAVADLAATASDPATGTLPAQRVQVEVTVELAVEATGSGFVGDQAAAGVVTLFNLTDADVLAPSGTRLQTPEGVAFETIGEVTIPAGPDTFVPVEVVAVEPGEEGNVPEQAVSAVVGALSDDLAALNNEPLAGGTDREAVVVEQDDVDRVDTLVRDLLAERGLAQLQEAYPETGDNPRLLFLETVDTTVLETQTTPAIGEEGQFAFASITGQVGAMSVSFDDVQSYLAGQMMATVPSGDTVPPESVLFNVTGVEASDDAEGRTTVTFFLAASARSGPVIDPGEVRDLVTGKSVESARAALAEHYDLAGEPVIDRAFDEVPWLPFLDFRVDVDIVSGE
ncbi:MAG: hypothetical protein GEU28_11105 [Dehalococcoidia bacterium]|nr:hypothetical protein [Dehalococcoidia bacterium]